MINETNTGQGKDNYGRVRAIAWKEYETIACHPKFPERLRIVRHPNGPAVVHGPFLCSVGYFIRQVGESLGPVEAGDYDDWIAEVLAVSAQNVSMPPVASNPRSPPGGAADSATGTGASAAPVRAVVGRQSEDA
ncbi:MAG: hypothetical protein KGN77_05085 [Xanthomonadaceae bacterium]|nr:hypothetical protein [Xanthomonadaceae bacterium]